MKKVIVSAITIVMTLVMLASCGAASVEGVYKTKTIDGKTPVEFFEAQAEESGMDLDSMLALFALAGETVTRDDLSNYLCIDIQKGGKAVVSSFLSDGDKEGSWEKKDNVVTVTVAEDPMEFTFENGELTVDLEGVKLVLSK